MVDITVHIPDDRVSEFYLMLGRWLAQETDSPQAPGAAATQDWVDSESDLDLARTVWRKFSTRAKDAVLVLLDYPGEAITGQDLAPAAGIGDGGQQRFLAAVLAVAQNGTTDCRAVHAQLMRPSGARPQRQKRRALAGPIDHAEVGQRLLAILLIDLH